MKVKRNILICIFLLESHRKTPRLSRRGSDRPRAAGWGEENGLAEV